MSRLLILIATLLLPLQAFASEPLILHQTLLAERLNKEGTKGYNKYLSTLLSNYKNEVKPDTSPIKRSSRRFAKDVGSCLFPSNIQALRSSRPELKDTKLVVSLPVDYVSFNVYVPLDMPIPEQLSDLNGMRLGHASGSVATNLLKDKNLDVTFLRVTTEEQLVNILSNDRVDAIVGFHPDIAIAFERLGHPGLNYSPQLTLFKVPVSFICHPSKKTEAFLLQMNKAIISLNKSGKAQEYLGQLAEIIPLEKLIDTDATPSY